MEVRFFIKQIIIILFFLVMISMQTCAASKPTIRILPDTTLDLGTIVQGQKGFGTVRIKNAGNDTLRIKRVKASCGCTAALVKEHDLAPSDSTELSITFDSGKMKGEVEKEITITSNDSTHPTVVVHFTANVITILDVDPHAFIFLKCTRDSFYTKELTITNPSKKDTLHLLAVEPKSENLIVTPATMILRPGESTRLTGTFHATQEGFSRMSIMLTIDHPLQKQFEIIATAWVK